MHKTIFRMTSAISARAHAHSQQTALVEMGNYWKLDVLAHTTHTRSLALYSQ